MVGLSKSLISYNSLTHSYLTISSLTYLYFTINPPIINSCFVIIKISQGLDSILLQNCILQIIIKFITYDVILYSNLCIQLIIAFVSDYSATIYEHALLNLCAIVCVIVPNATKLNTPLLCS